MENIAIQVVGLNKKYKSKDMEIIANDDINLVIKKGEILGILGPNGAGKSTLIKQIIGYLSSSSGNIEILGDPIHGKRKLMLGRIGYMMQSRYSHWDHLTVKEALYYSGRLKKLSQLEIKNQISYFSERLELDQEINRTINSLSGGKKQATALACSLIGYPEILILDEPTNGLDPSKRILLWDFLKEVNKDRNTTILIITHNANEVEKIANRIVIMGDGKVLISGTSKDLRANIDDEIRLEIEFQHPTIIEKNSIIKDHFHTWSQDNTQLFIYTSQNNMVTLIESLFKDMHLNKSIKNIQIHKSTMEDIYIRIMGQKIVS